MIEEQKGWKEKQEKAIFQNLNTIKKKKKGVSTIVNNGGEGNLGG